MRNKKFLLTILAVFAVMTAFADNYTVIVYTLKHIKWEDKKGHIVAIEIEPGDSILFEVTAGTPEEAKNKAVEECEAKCLSSIYIRVQSDVIKNNILCDRYERIIPHRPKVKLQ